MDYLLAPDFHAEFYLTQVVSHFHEGAVARFVATAERRGLALPGVFGVFFYRSANARTLDALKSFLPVPAEGLTREFASGATPEEVCAHTIRALMDVGARHFYISNLPIGRAQPSAGRHPRAGRTSRPNLRTAMPRLTIAAALLMAAVLPAQPSKPADTPLDRLRADDRAHDAQRERDVGDLREIDRNGRGARDRRRPSDGDHEHDQDPAHGRGVRADQGRQDPD